MLINIKCLTKICLFEIYFYNFAVVKTTNHKLKKEQPSKNIQSAVCLTLTQKV